MQAIIRGLWNIIDVVIALILIIMVILVFSNVVMRYGFSSGLRESVEISRLGLVWVVMLGAVVVLKRDEHLAVTEFTDRLMPRLVPFLRRVCWAIILGCVTMLFIGSYEQMLQNWDDISQLTGLPSGLFYLAGTVSGGLMIMLSFIRIFFPDWLLEKS